MVLIKYLKKSAMPVSFTQLSGTDIHDPEQTCFAYDIQNVVL